MSEDFFKKFGLESSKDSASIFLSLSGETIAALATGDPEETVARCKKEGLNDEEIVERLQFLTNSARDGCGSAGVFSLIKERSVRDTAIPILESIQNKIIQNPYTKYYTCENADRFILNNKSSDEHMATIKSRLQEVSDDQMKFITDVITKQKKKDLKVTSPVEKDFLKTPLHITWMNETMAYIEKMVLSNKSLKPLFDEMMALGSVKGRAPKNSAEADLLEGLNLVFSAKNAQEVVVKDKGEPLTIRSDWDLKSAFKPIFEDMIINMHYKGGGYMPFFMQLFKLDEDYIDPVTKEASPVYIAKTMTKAENVVTTGIPSNYKAVFEAILIQSKLPRVIFPSYISKVCIECTISNETSMMAHVYGKANEGVRYCLKTPRTFHSCRVVDMKEPYPGNPNATFAEVGFGHLKMMMDVLEKLNRPPEHITKFSIEKVQREYAFKERSRYLNHDERTYIEIKDVVVDIVKLDAEPKEHKGGTHASPCRHVRRPTVRHYKSGKVGPVRGSIVNPSGKKPIYVIKG